MRCDLDRGTPAGRPTRPRRADGTWELGRPKTTHDRRPFALMGSCVVAPRRHRAGQAAERLRLGSPRTNHGFVFAHWTGGTLRVISAMAHFGRLAASTGVPTTRLQDLRQTAATLLLAEGVRPKTAQARADHATAATTLDGYSDFSEGMRRDAADRLNAVLGRATGAAARTGA